MLKTIKTFFKRLFKGLIYIALTGVVLVFGINAYVKFSTKGSILTVEELTKEDKSDCILILGCQVRADGTPSLMLSDRLDRGIELYKQGVAPKIIMSGDHGTKYYNEVGTMRQYAIDAGVPSSDIFMDHAGFSTYDSMYRAKEIFGVKKVTVVTQEYHLYRALYIGKKLGMEVNGSPSEGQNYAGQRARDLREVLARVKDFFTTILKPEPTYLGEKISLEQDGNVTDAESVTTNNG